MLEALKQQMQETEQKFAEDPISIAKMIFDSLAFRYASVLGSIESLTRRKLAGHSNPWRWWQKPVSESNGGEREWSDRKSRPLRSDRRGKCSGAGDLDRPFCIAVRCPKTCS